MRVEEERNIPAGVSLFSSFFFKKTGGNRASFFPHKTKLNYMDFRGGEDIRAFGDKRIERGKGKHTYLPLLLCESSFIFIYRLPCSKIK
jgi:hypothetical protein